MHKRGFTLLEILVVIIIIGILATLALPQYMKTTRKARAGEAISNIGSIRGALLRYYQEYDEFTNVITKLDIEDPAGLKGAYFNYTITAEGETLESFIITATGKPTKVTKNVTVTYEASSGKITTTGLD